MTQQIKPEHENFQTERDLVSPCLWSFNRKLILRDRDRQRRFMKRVLALAATIVIALFVTTSAIAQEQQRAYSE